MRQELRFYRTEKAIEIEAEGQVIATLPMTEEQPQPAPEPEPEPKSIRYAFAEWNPQVTHTRLTEPKTQWAVLHCLSENQRSILLPANVTNPKGILSLTMKKQTASYNGTEKPYTSGVVYSAKLFGLGRVDVRANLQFALDFKNSIWLTTSPYTTRDTGKLKQLVECDVVEYTPADTGEFNTARGMWLWQENKQSVSADRLPYIDLTTKTSLSGGSWWWDKAHNAWYQWALYPVCRNGNRLKGTNGKYYFVTNTERGTYIPSTELTWIREDGVEGKGLDGNKYFTVEPTDPIGGGAVKSQFLDGNKKVAGWHTWSIVMDNTYIAYLCDDVEYWRSPEPLNLPDDLTYNLIFATSNITDRYTGEHTMQVESVTYTPKSNG